MRASALYRLAGIGEIAAGVSTNYGAPPHTHDTYSIGIFHGPARIRLRGRTQDLAAGSIAMLEPGEVHGGTPLSRHCRQDGILLDAGFMVAAFGAERPFDLPVPVIAEPELARRLSLAAAAGNGEAISALLRTLFERHGRARIGGAPLRSPAIAPTMPLDATVAAASQASGRSRWQFHRRLRAISGLSPRDLRRQLRVAKARKLIEAGESLAAAAIEAGFADQAHMSRQLRSLLGITPAALRPSR